MGEEGVFAGTVTMSYRRKLTIFRLGLFACFAWAIFTATSFDMLGSAFAVWNGNPTGLELAQARATFERKQDACQKAATKQPKQEFSSSCLSERRPMVGMPRDEALRNLVAFGGSFVVLVIGVLLIARMGARMAREPDDSVLRLEAKS